MVKNFIIFKLLICFIVYSPLNCALPLPNGTPSTNQRRIIYNSIPYHGLCELLSFSLLYPATQEGLESLQEAWKLIFPMHSSSFDDLGRLITAAPDLVLMSSSAPTTNNSYQDQAIALIENAAKHLGNRRLKGYGVTDINLIVSLPPEELDLSRALLLAELEENPDRIQIIRVYEASLDWMALQIAATLQKDASDEDKIAAINKHLFQTLKYRFPSTRKYSKQVDSFSLLGKVIEARQGVCLGVSCLFASLAQRLNLPYVFITPPGHIFVRYETSKKYRNIETTASGIHIDDEKYLGLEMDVLPRRNNRETIGLAHINAGSTYWHKGDYVNALDQYGKARRYMGDDSLLLSLTGFCTCFNGDEQGGKEILRLALKNGQNLIMQPKSIVEDILSGNTDVASVQVIYNEVEKDRPALETYRQQLEEAVARCPKFRAGWLQLAMTWMELQREENAIDCLKKFHALDASDLTVEFLLAELSLSRQDPMQAWTYLKNAEMLGARRKKLPRSIKQLRTMLSAECASGEET